VNGIVQGVGFRPFVFNLATSLKLKGFVNNASNGVEIEIEGKDDQLEKFFFQLENNPPPLSEIQSFVKSKINVCNSKNFIIQPSEPNEAASTLISPDMSICKDCLKDIFDPENRRYLYPFTNCTNCGPRYTIIKSIPYDRPFTTMQPFKMCPNCQREYDDPRDRRFHAQPNACSTCGPKIWYEDNSAQIMTEDNLSSFTRLATDLNNGKMIAIKGIGGFHLCVDALNDSAVKILRSRKNREQKPLAIMVSSPDDINDIAHLTKNEMNLLTSAQKPIVLLEKNKRYNLAQSVAPDNNRIGVMLPYTPLHAILFKILQEKYPHIKALIMTSANISDEPIAIKNETARKKLSRIADHFLMHNRDILIRNDDSVAMEINSKTVFFRRSRGYSPKPIFLNDDASDVLAVGGELKNTICITKGNQAFLSQHIGDLENYEANLSFEKVTSHLGKIIEAKPNAVICDLHPEYFSTKWSLEQKQYPVFQAQHHHAHMASVMAEHHIHNNVMAIILDGSGFGYDGNIWGGEFLMGNLTTVERFAHFQYLPLAGGEKAIKNPWRTAVGWLYSIYGDRLPQLPFMEDQEISIIKHMIDKNLNSPLTSSCGRLFDCVSAMCGVRSNIAYEGQAAIELMQMVEHNNQYDSYAYEITYPEVTIKPILDAIIIDLNNGVNVSTIVGRFHQTIVQLLTDLAILAKRRYPINEIVLSGGVLQNEILLMGLMASLTNAGFKVYMNEKVPINDGGLSLGQAAIGRELLKQNLETVKYSIYK
jgi:hydrogenase maturation protein HypF